MGVADSLGNWAGEQGSLYQHLANALRTAIERGDLRVGQRLPAERIFARDLAVSRTTVAGAYTLLKEEGWLESRQGSGTVVSRRPQNAEELARALDPIPSLRGNAFLQEGAAIPIDMATAALPGCAEVSQAIRSITERELSALLASNGYAPAGLGILRQAVADHFAHMGVPTTAQQILITTGDQQAISLLVDMFARSGDTVVVENPTSPGALDAFRTAGVHLRSVPVDQHGASLDELDKLVAGTPVRLIYLIPTFHNPTGVVLSPERRRRVARLARELQVTVIEDMSHANIALRSQPQPPIAQATQSSWLITIGSMSKLFWGGLRVGWIRAAEPIINRLMRHKAVADLGTPLLSQLVAARLLPRAEEVQSERQAMLVARLERISRLIGAALPSWRWHAPEGGLSLWIKLPSGQASAFSQVALRHGVAIVPGTLLSADGSHDDHLRLSFGLDPEVLDIGIDRLACAWQAYIQGAQSRAYQEPQILV